MLSFQAERTSIVPCHLKTGVLRELSSRRRDLTKTAIFGGMHGQRYSFRQSRLEFILTIGRTVVFCPPPHS